MEKDIEYFNSVMAQAIAEHIHKKRDRIILYLYYIDGRSPEWMVEHKKDYPDIDIEPRQIRSVIKKCLEKLTDYI